MKSKKADTAPTSKDQHGYVAPFPYDCTIYVALGFELLIVYRYLMVRSLGDAFHIYYSPLIPFFFWPLILWLATFVAFLFVKNVLVRAMIVAALIETPAFWLYVFVEPSVIMASWFTIAALSAGSTVLGDMFRDLQSRVATIKTCTDEQYQQWAVDFLAEDCRFYMERVTYGLIILGTILAACMTILWTAPGGRFSIDPNFLYLASGDMLLGFTLIVGAIGLWLALPLWHALVELRKVVAPAAESNINAES